MYDDNNQLAGVQIPNLGFVSINEYNWTRPASMTLPGGSIREFEYYPFMRIAQITAKDPGQNVLMDYQYTYDKMDNITAKATEHGNYDYSYDDLYRLTGVDNPDFDDEDFTYDSVGNRLTSADITGEWTYNENNELETYDGISYVYDDNGNMTEKDDNGLVTRFFYNMEDRLERVEDGSGNVIATYYYDPFGRRLWKEVSGTRTYFHYADEGLIGEYDAAGDEIKTYGWKPGSTWSTDPLFMKIGSQYYFCHNDNLGTPQKMTAINGAVVWSAKYESFGKAAIEIEAVENNFRFPGQYEDEETGLHYNWFRYFDPENGRLLMPDPIGLAGGVNYYIYVQSNPINKVDPYGLWAWGINVGGSFTFKGVKSGASTALIFDSEGNFAIITSQEKGIGASKAIGLFNNIVFGGSGTTVDDYAGAGFSISGSGKKFAVAGTTPLCDNDRLEKNFYELGYVPWSIGSAEAGITYTTGQKIFETTILGDAGRWWGEFFYDVIH